MKTSQPYLECLWEDWGGTDHDERQPGKCSSASAEAVLIWGPSLQVEGWLLCVETCPDTQRGASRSGRAWWGLSVQRHQGGEEAQVPMPQCSLCCHTAPHLAPYLAKLSLSQRLRAFMLLAWILGLIRKQQLFQGDSTLEFNSRVNPTFQIYIGQQQF